MILTGLEIERQMRRGSIRIEPYDSAQRNPNSYDMRLGPTLLVYRRPAWPSQAWRRLRGLEPRCLDPALDNPVDELAIPAGGLVLKPGRLYLGTTIEWVGTNHYASAIDGKSSIGRLGVLTHVTAGFIDVGFHGNLTTETAVVEPVRVYAGMRFCQVSFSRVWGRIELYKGRYQAQQGAVACRSHLDFGRRPSARTETTA